MSRQAGQGANNPPPVTDDQRKLQANTHMDARRLGLRERILGRTYLALRAELSSPRLSKRGPEALGVVAGGALVVGVALCLPWYRWPEGRTASALEATWAGPARWASLVFVLVCALVPMGVRLSTSVRAQARWLFALRWLVSVSGVMLLLVSAGTMTNEELKSESIGPAWGVVALPLGVGVAIVALFFISSETSRSVPWPFSPKGAEALVPLSSAEIDVIASGLSTKLVESIPPRPFDERSQWATTSIWSAAGLFGTAGVATLASWERFDFPALGAGADGLHRVANLPPVVQAVTLALAALACAITAVLARRTSMWLGAAAIVAGGATSMAIYTVARSIPARGGIAEIQLGMAPKMGISAAVAGTLLLVVVQLNATKLARGEERFSPSLLVTTGIVVVALTCGGAVGAAASSASAPNRAVVEAELGDEYELVMGGGTNSLPWGKAPAEADVSAESGSFSNSIELRSVPQVAVDLDGGPGIWLFSPTPDGVMASTSEDGHVMPQVALEGGDYRVEVAGITGQTAIVVAEDDDVAVVLSVPFNQPQAWLPGNLAEREQDDLGYDVEPPNFSELLRVPSDSRGQLRSVDAVADGSLAVTVWTDAETELHVVPHHRLNDPEAWELSAPVASSPDFTNLTASPDGAVQYGAFGELRLVGDDDRVVLGGASDPDCAISDQPLEINLEGINALAVDRDGNRWVSVGRSDGPELLVQRPDGEIRLAPTGTGGVESMFASPNGDLVISTYPTRSATARVVRLPNAAESVDGFERAPSVSSSCTKRAEAGVETLGATFEPVSSELEPEARLVAGDGTVVTVNSADSKDLGDLELRYPDGTTEKIADYNVAGEYVGDGRGGVWWVDGNLDAEGVEPALVHRGADGELFRLDLPGDRYPNSLSADPSTGDLFFLTPPSFPVARWSRVSVGGSPQRVPGTDDDLEGAGFAQVVGRGEMVVQRADNALISVGTGAGRTLLGARQADAEALPLGVALAEGAPAERYPVGEVAVGPDGLPWMLVSGYLVRVPEEGVVEVLAGPDDGLPPDASALVPLGDDMFVRTPDAMFKVVVS